MSAHLIAPHGGGSLVDLFAAPPRVAEIGAASRDWPSHDLTPRQLCDLELLLDGGFSPLTGFMTSRDHAAVCSDMRLADGTLWPIPITLDVGGALADELAPGDRLALRDPEGVMLAVLHVEDVWRPDREAEAEAVFGTANREHPGVAHLDRTAPAYVGGRVEGVQPVSHYDYEQLRHTPADLRGEEAQRILRGRDDVRVMVRYPREQRRSLGHLEDMRIRLPDGGEVPFSHVARVEPGRGFASIRRIDRNRAVNVTASVDPQVVSTAALVADLRSRILPEVVAEFPDVFYVFRGTQEAQEEAVGDLRGGLLLALVMIFGLLAIPLRSYAQPLIIMGAIPFGLVGALWGHVVMGLDVTFLSLLGFVALTGIVVNDSLIMVDFINRARSVPAGTAAAEGSPQDGGPPAAASLEHAIRQAGGQRFRPIVLTSLTTFAGLIPMLADRSMQAAFFVPMAASLAFGVLFATVITLFLVPVAYAILDDLQRLPLFARRRG